MFSLGKSILGKAKNTVLFFIFRPTEMILTFFMKPSVRSKFLTGNFGPVHKEIYEE